jgi:HlyD family secretion protein
VRIQLINFCLPGLVIALLAGCGGKKDKNVIEVTGTLEARAVTVAAKEGGTVARLYVDEGSAVRANDTLAIIDHALLDIQRAQAQAGVDLADAQSRLLQQGAREEDRRQAQEALKQAAAAFSQAETDVRRARDLFASGSVPQKQKDDAETRLTMAQSAQAAAEEAVKKIEHLARTEEVRAARARVDQAQAGVALLARRIHDCTLLAPVTGTVTHRLAEPGELAGPGTPLCEVVPLDTLELVVYLTEVELGRVKLGDQAQVRIDADPQREFTGTVGYISPLAEFTPKNVQTKEDRVKLVFGVKLRVPNPDGVLKPGMPADASIKTTQK